MEISGSSCELELVQSPSDPASGRGAGRLCLTRPLPHRASHLYPPPRCPHVQSSHPWWVKCRRQGSVHGQAAPPWGSSVRWRRHHQAQDTASVQRTGASVQLAVPWTEYPWTAVSTSGFPCPASQLGAHMPVALTMAPGALRGGLPCLHSPVHVGCLLQPRVCTAPPESPQKPSTLLGQAWPLPPQCPARCCVPFVPDPCCSVPIELRRPRMISYKGRGLDRFASVPGCHVAAPVRHHSGLRRLSCPAASSV